MTNTTEKKCCEECEAYESKGEEAWTYCQKESCECHTEKADRPEWAEALPELIAKVRFYKDEEALKELTQFAENLLTTREAEAYKQGQMNPKVGFLRQYLNETPDWKGTLWTDDHILEFLRIPFTTNPKETTCEHDFPRAIRKGRASYECPTCHEGISMAWFYWMDAIKD